MLGYADAPERGGWESALVPPVPEQPLGEIRPLFPKARAEPPPATPAALPTGPVAVPLAVRAGVVKSVAVHPSADKLYVLEVDVGDAAPRTLVAGLRPSYTPEELTGRAVVVLANLAPRTIRRMTSQGMVLAADAGERSVVIAPPEGVAPGTYLSGTGGSDRTITYEEFASVPLVVGRVTGAGAEGTSVVAIGGPSVTVAGTWPVGTTGVVRLSAPAADRGEFLAFGPGLAARPSAEVPPGAKVR